MKILGIIPARLASTRFPAKPLVDIGGTSMVMRTFRQAQKCPLLADVVVATDDQGIFDHVVANSGKVVLTRTNHDTGTSRCAEVQQQMPHFDACINIQGDEPFISPNQISAVAQLLIKGAEIATLAKPDSNRESLMETSAVKVVLNHKNEAMLFSRSLIPFVREYSDSRTYTWLRHVGIYGYRADILKQLVTLPTAPPEQYESLEQLRWMYNGYKIEVGLTDEDSHSIDTPADLERVKKHFGY